MTFEQAEARRIIERILDISGLLPTQLARKAGLAPSTLNKFLNQPDVKYTPSFKTLRRLMVASDPPFRFTVELSARQPENLDVERFLTAFGMLSATDRDFLLTVMEVRARQIDERDGATRSVRTGT